MYSQTTPTWVCTSFILVDNFSFLKHLYIFIEKGKKSFITIFKRSHHLICFSKTPPFPDHGSPWSIYSNNSYHSIWYSCVTPSPIHFLLRLKSFSKTCTWSRTASQLSISEDSAIRIVLTLCRGSTLLAHTHPVTHRVSHVPPYQVYAKLSHRP